jgi:hypothetical protein
MKSLIKVSEFARAEENKMIFKLISIPPDFFGMSLSDITSAQTRYYDMVLYFPLATKKKTTYKIPEGYNIKSIPEDITFDNDYALFKCLTKKIDNCTIEVNMEFLIKAVRIPKDKYDQFRDFCAKVHQAAEREIVLETK